MTKYVDLKGQSDALLARIESESQQQNDWKVAAELVAQFSLEVKSYLLPSLGRVASSLISVITGGARNQVRISNDFEIFVDNQPVSTLSGSAKVAVNLALRVGLGQVLTSSTFPVFLADEVDASFDSERSETTIECIQNLTNTMQQVILVSHKQISGADQYIRMPTGKRTCAMRNCLDCEVDISDRHGLAERCEACAAIRKRILGRESRLSNGEQRTQRNLGEKPQMESSEPGVRKRMVRSERRESPGENGTANGKQNTPEMAQKIRKSGGTSVADVNFAKVA